MRPRPLVQSDPRDAFDCGNIVLNSWLSRHAWRNQITGASRTYVLVDDDGQILGYFSLAVGEIRREFVPRRDQRNVPDPLPIALLGQLAVDSSQQGKGLSKFLLAHAFACVREVARAVGCVALITHPIDENARRFYERWGLQALEGDPRGAMYIRIKDLDASGFR